MTTTLRSADFIHALPLLFVAGWACLVLLASALGEQKSSRLGPLTLLGLILAMGLTFWSWTTHSVPAVDVFGGMLVIDRFGLFFDLTFLLAGLLTVLLSGAYLEEQRFGFGEYYSLILLVITGMMLLVHSGDFVIFVIGLETLSVGVYALAASWAGNRKSAEGALKYFIMGATATALLLYGISLIYGATGQTNLLQIAREAGRFAGEPLFLLGMYLVLVGMAFKIALVPFHGWAPDAYEGAPTTITGFMATAVKAAAFGALLRVFLVAFGDDAFTFGSTGWTTVLYTLAILTMTLGNLAALRQANIKRMLAYSSISHAGYLLLGVIAAGVLPEGSASSVLFYLLAYTVTTIGAFGMVVWLGSYGDERVTVSSWAGLAARHPAAALAMTIFLLSLTGMPPTAGFFAKFYIFRDALQHEQLIPLVIIAVLNSVVSVYYYLRPIVAMYFREETTAPRPLQSGAVSFALLLAVILVLLLGLTPGAYLAFAEQSLLALGR